MFVNCLCCIVCVFILIVLVVFVQVMVCKSSLCESCLYIILILYAEKLILTAPPLPEAQYPIFATSPVNPASKQAQAITSFAFSPPSSPTSPSSLTVSSTLGEVAYSTATDPSCTSFEDMSSKDEKEADEDDKDDQISDFSEPDEEHSKDKEKEKDDIVTTTKTSDNKDNKDEVKDTSGKREGQLRASEELPEFVIVPTSHSSSEG